MMRWLGVVLCGLVACGDAPSETPDAPGGEVDAAVDATPSGPPARYTISRGVAGAERLFAVDGDNVVEISTGAGQPWCGGRVFCNLPPNGGVGRFVGAQYVAADRVFYVELDPVDWSRIRVVTANTATGAQTNLASFVAWPATTPDWPINYVVATAAHGGTIWVSLPVANGMGLYRTDGLLTFELVETLSLPSGRTYMDSTVHASAEGVVWSVRWRTGMAGPDPYAYRTVVLDPNGNVRLRVPEDITGAVDGADAAYLVDGTVTIHWERADGTMPLELYEIAGGERHVLDVPNAYVAVNGPGADGLVLVGRAGSDTTTVFDADTAAMVDELEGMSWGVHDGKVIYRRQTQPLELVERDATAHTERVLAPQSSVSFNAMGGVFAPGGRTVAVADGAPYLDLNENVGIAVVDRATLARTQVEPQEPSEGYTRQLAFTADGQWLVYVHPVDGVLQLAAFQIPTGRREVLTTGADQVRQVVLPAAP